MPGGECDTLAGSDAVLCRDTGEAVTRRSEAVARRDSANGIDKVRAVTGQHHDTVGPSSLFTTSEVSAQPAGRRNVRTDHWHTRAKILERLQRERCPGEWRIPIWC